MPSILFIASHRLDRAPGQRFRFEQYFDHLERNGFRCELSHLVTEQDDAVLYRKGYYMDKARFVYRCHSKRKADLERMHEFDIIFIFREALMSRSTVFEEAFRKGGARIVFDFDDSIWLPNVSAANRRWAWMKNPGKTARIIGMSDLVFAGNPYLADHARGYNPNVVVVPTTIDTDLYRPVTVQHRGPVVIGWSGSITTIAHFQYALPFLRMVSERFGDRVAFRVIGDGSFREPSLNIQGMPWRRDTELQDLAGIDIGIMPLPDDPWAKGKCGLKGLQYMALGIPAIMSPVGVNTEIIQDGVNGYLADGTGEWLRKLSILVEDAELRRKIGMQARRTVEERYSVKVWRDRYLQLFNDLLKETPRHG